MKQAAANAEIIFFVLKVSSQGLWSCGHLWVALFVHERERTFWKAHSCLCFGLWGRELIMRQLFLLVLVTNVEICCFTFLLSHLGHATFAFSCSLKLFINENFLPQASQTYSYVGMFFPPYQDQWYRYFLDSILIKSHILSSIVDKFFWCMIIRWIAFNLNVS